jgi:hypothetical protein
MRCVGFVGNRFSVRNDNRHECLDQPFDISARTSRLLAGRDKETDGAESVHLIGKEICGTTSTRNATTQEGRE